MNHTQPSSAASQVHGFLRVAAASPAVVPADTAANASHICHIIAELHARQVALAVFPEMCLTGYTCGDLFHQRPLLDGAMAALQSVVEATRQAPGLTVVVGMPVERRGVMYNCGVALRDGRPLAVVPKTFVPNYNEFYERRWWAPAPEAVGLTVPLLGDEVPFGTDVAVAVGDALLGIEICEDLWAPVAPSSSHALAGCELLANLSASDDLVGKYAYLTDLVSRQSAACIAAYIYASAGFGESSTDLVFDGKTMVAESGRMLAAGKRWERGDRWCIADVDLQALRHDRVHNTTFAASAAGRPQMRVVGAGATLQLPADPLEYRTVDPHPFVPASDNHRAERCEEIVAIQVAGLAKRLQHTACRSLVVGVSGGLDSTLALLVAAKAFDSLGLDRKGIVGVTMPGFGTTNRTYTNALALIEALGVTAMEVSIRPAVEQHFKDIGHDPAVTDVTYENSQARERTQILMDLANRFGGMVLGTGDMSELALGWATYNGDHMSMYGVNAGVPKTLVRHLVRYFADSTASTDERRTLLDIIDTPISPELTPAAADGTIAQCTEDLVGPYELHDFFLYNMLRFGFGPSRIMLLARKAFAGVYPDDVLRHWLRVFVRRFFAQQFKRSCMPDGPKVGSVCLSPRGDWRMPSDASAALWIAEVDAL